MNRLRLPSVGRSYEWCHQLWQVEGVARAHLGLRSRYRRSPLPSRGYRTAAVRVLADLANRLTGDCRRPDHPDHLPVSVVMTVSPNNPTLAKTVVSRRQRVASRKVPVGRVFVIPQPIPRSRSLDIGPCNGFRDDARQGVFAKHLRSATHEFPPFLIDAGGVSGAICFPIPLPLSVDTSGLAGITMLVDVRLREERCRSSERPKRAPSGRNIAAVRSRSAMTMGNRIDLKRLCPDGPFRRRHLRKTGCHPSNPDRNNSRNP